MKKRTLSERENALRAITRSTMPEWVPVFADCCEIVVPSLMHERPPMGGKEGKDWFGCNWVFDELTNAWAPDLSKPYILEDVADWRDVVQFPDLDAVDWEACAEKDMANVDRENKVVRLMIESGPFERSHHLLGFENAFLAMYDDPEEYQALLDAITDYKVALINKLIPAYKPDSIFFHDDLGHSKAPMMSIEAYRQFLKKNHKRIGDAITSQGVIYNHHSCGVMNIFIDDLLEAGATWFHPMQPENGHKEIAEKYSRVASFDCAYQTINDPRSTEEQVRTEVHAIIDAFGPYGNVMVGGFPSNMDAIHLLAIADDEARIYGGSFYD